MSIHNYPLLKESVLKNAKLIKDYGDKWSLPFYVSKQLKKTLAEDCRGPDFLCALDNIAVAILAMGINAEEDLLTMKVELISGKPVESTDILELFLDLLLDSCDVKTLWSTFYLFVIHAIDETKCLTNLGFIDACELIRSDKYQQKA